MKLTTPTYENNRADCKAMCDLYQYTNHTLVTLFFDTPQFPL